MRRATATVLAAVTLTIAWEFLVGGVRIGDRVIHLGMLSYLGVVLLVFPVSTAPRAQGLRDVWIALSAMTLADLPAMATRGTAVASIGRDLSLGVVLACGLMLPLAGISRGRRQGRGTTLRELWFLLMVAATTIGAFQWFNRAARSAGVPNEERSLMVGGVEIHHLNWGIMLIIMAATLGASIDLRLGYRGFLCIVGGFGLGMVVDEWFYYMAQEVTDAEYFSVKTWTSSLGLMTVLALAWSLWLALQRRRHMRRPE